VALTWTQPTIALVYAALMAVGLVYYARVVRGSNRTAPP